jgi:hypothetical protein
MALYSQRDPTSVLGLTSLLTTDICELLFRSDGIAPLMTSPAIAQNIEYWPVERLVEYPRNPPKNDTAVDRMCSSIREFGFKISDTTHSRWLFLIDCRKIG